MDAVDQVLLQRAGRESNRPLVGGLAAAALLHAGLFFAALLVASWRPPAPAIDFVPVTILPAQALGVERPRARPQPPAPAPAPAPTPPAPAPEPPKAKAQQPEPPAHPEPPKREISPEVERRPVLHNVLVEQTAPKP